MSRSSTSPGKPRALPGWRRRVEDRLLDVQFVVYGLLVAALLILGFLWPRVFVVVPTGHHAVMYRFFAGGTVTDRVWGEGVHVIPPWDHLSIYETRLQQQTLAVHILSEEGLDLGARVSVRFRPDAEMLGYLHQDVGPDYFDRLISPEVEAHVRRTFGRRPAHELYASANDLLQELSRVPLLGLLEGEDTVSRPYVQIQELKLIDIDLPEIVAAAIAEKYRQEQLMLEYRYKLDRERQESDRRRIEASGIRDYNTIVGELSPDVLRWRSIEATTELARSDNSKVVVLGGGNVPLMLSLGDQPLASPPASTSAPPQASAEPARP